MMYRELALATDKRQHFLLSGLLVGLLFLSATMLWIVVSVMVPIDDEDTNFRRRRPLPEHVRVAETKRRLLRRRFRRLWACVGVSFGLGVLKETADFYQVGANCPCHAEFRDILFNVYGIATAGILLALLIVFYEWQRKEKEEGEEEFESPFAVPIEAGEDIECPIARSRTLVSGHFVDTSSADAKSGKKKTMRETKSSN